MRQIKHGKLGGCSDSCCLKLEDVSVRLDGDDILKQVSFHLHCGEIDLFKEHLSQHHGFSLDEGRTLLYGLCAACQNKEETH